MAKSGAKYIGLSVVMMAVGVVCAYLVDQFKGDTAAWLIRISLVLCLGGAALFLLGLFKVAAGLLFRRGRPEAEVNAPAHTGEKAP